MPIDKYLNRNDVSLRLSGCVGQYKGQYCTIWLPERDDVPERHVILRDLVTNNSILRGTVDANSDDLSVTGMQLGYMTEGSLTGYVSRAPVRRQSEGINRNNLLISKINEPRNSLAITQNIIQSTGFERMLKGIYPSFEEIKDLVLENTTGYSTAFSRSCALLKARKGVALFFENNLVGYFDEEMTNVTLLEDYRHSIMIQKLNKIGGFYVNA